VLAPGIESVNARGASLIQDFAEQTAQYLTKQHRSATCPFVLPLHRTLLACNQTETDSFELKQSLSEKVHATHAAPPFSWFVDSIVADRQRELQLFISAHGNREMVGVSPDCRHGPCEAAELIDAFFQHHDPSDKLDIKNREFTIIFHTCNTAVPVLPPGSDDRDSGDQKVLQEDISQHTFLGKFWHEMHNNYNYSNITVTGYRGYLSCLPSRQGFVCSDTGSSNPKVVLPSTSCQFSIRADGSVVLPTHNIGRSFSVTFRRRASLQVVATVDRTE
jgi:hypothetical protein